MKDGSSGTRGRSSYPQRAPSLARVIDVSYAQAEHWVGTDSEDNSGEVGDLFILTFGTFVWVACYRSALPTMNNNHSSTENNLSAVVMYGGSRGKQSLLEPKMYK
jgi:hypothetical protein